MRVYLDFEFINLGRVTEPISIGLTTDAGESFYGEFTDYPKEMIAPGDWVDENVIQKLWLKTPPPAMPLQTQYVVGTQFEVTALMEGWLSQQYFSSDANELHIWSDVYAYDWVLFCNLFGGMMSIPKFIYYIPFDLATLLHIKEIDPDISREAFAMSVLDVAAPTALKHNALFDAMIIGMCVRKALGL